MISYVLNLCFFSSRATSEASLSWLKYLKKKKIPVIICMTHGDVLYFEEEDRRQNDKFVKEKDEITEEVRREIGSEVYVSAYIYLILIAWIVYPKQ